MNFWVIKKLVSVKETSIITRGTTLFSCIYFRTHIQFPKQLALIAFNACHVIDTCLSFVDSISTVLFTYVRNASLTPSLARCDYHHSYSLYQRYMILSFRVCCACYACSCASSLIPPDCFYDLFIFLFCNYHYKAI